MKTALIALFAMSSVNAFAAEDLKLEGERWHGKPTGYLCGASTTSQVERPASLASFDVNFESVTTDYSLDNGLLKGTFVEDGVTCRYSALILANNATKVLTLVESRAYAADEATTCEQGKALLDGYFAETEYLYWGRPHHVTVMIAEPNAAELCGKEAAKVGIDFVVAGRL